MFWVNQLHIMVVSETHKVTGDHGIIIIESWYGQQ